MMSALDTHASDDADEVPGFVRAFRTLRERWWVVAICVVVCALAALIYVERQPKQYTATSKLQFSNSSVPSQVAGVPQPQSVDPEGEKATYLQLVTTTPVAELVVSDLKLKESPAQLLSEVSASNPNNDYIIDVSATSSSPKRAAEIANAFAQQYTIYSQSQNEAQLVKGEELINKRLTELPASDTTDAANLRALYQKLLLLQAVQTSNAHIVDTASTPGSPSSPKVKDTVLIALVVGLLIGIGLVFVIDVLDRRVKSLDAIEALYDLPAIATVPRLPRRPRTARQHEIAAEPFRILQNALPLAAGSASVKTVLVTSAVSGEGKTTVALGLARAAADTGRRVILVEADLRHPNLSGRLGLSYEGRPGLAAALLEEQDPTALLTGSPEDPENLQVLTVGQTSSHAVDLLSSKRLAEVFAALASNADLLVIDSAPLLPVADTRALLDRVDVDICLMVGRVGTTTRDQIHRARAVLDQRRPLNVALVVDDMTDTPGGYYYGDGHASGDSRKTASAPAKTERPLAAHSTRQHESRAAD